MAIALWRPCGAQSSALILQRLDSVANPPMTRNEALCFYVLEVDLGEMSEDDAARTGRFTFVNKGDKPLVITQVNSSCGCAQPQFSRKPVLAGEKADISVAFLPKGHPGQLNRHVYVYTNTSSIHPSARLTLRGNVQPGADQWQGYRIVMGPSLRAKRNVLSFGGMSRSQVRSERIECVNTGSSPLRLSVTAELLPTFISFRTEPEVIAPSETADLVVTVDGRRCPAKFTKVTDWMIYLEGAEGRASQLSLKIETEFID